jgi:hypothetical protein
LAVGVEPIRFAGEIRYFKPEKASGLAVVDVPDEHVGALGVSKAMINAVGDSVELEIAAVGRD